MLLDAPTLAAVAALGLGAAVIGGLGGFGTGVILAAALAPLIGMKALVPVLAVAGVIINADSNTNISPGFPRTLRVALTVTF